ncbi:MAG: hypothetical protein JRJ45_08845 [Deltaproteobacteria bacterium]|nr:hypothetical protein [Deltaproteobacteria bacterium]
MWVINIQHWLDETNTTAAVPQLRLKIQKLTEIITYTTSAVADMPTDSIPKCWRRPKRKPCKGILNIHIDENSDQIHWYCSSCNDEGVVTGWEGLIWDMRDRPVEVH